ncbi:4Fe-4S binding protein [Anaerosalibacter bizertensis]|uniref:4Fe-4S binding protein n=1 Tax=Anaerosalibacter bizertensis TaxID=932217 RepID=A0A9Q4AA77_9FIRM|nr:4Fe-4S binding protein [Anaerosalibacter bizertensis]MCG4564118.1 4Fe-4S binding protein [Anaerosalibacter bizertensis]MCG4583380.1 4Fe-4S binding protein [Anaerosalibacter bizertensis]
MLIKINYDRCKNCGKCVEVCPIGIIEMMDIPRIDETRCIKCKTCVAICPFKAIEIK